MSEKRSGSLTAAAYEQLRAEILAGRLKPGEKLTISDLCAKLGVSLGAVREALSKLTSEGLVHAQTNKGFRVAPITKEELEDITRVRLVIEPLCLESAIQNGDLKWETGIVSSLFELSKIPLQEPSQPEQINDDWIIAHQKFHEALVAACDSKWLLRIRETLYMQSERYRQASAILDLEGRDIHREHQDIADATLARDSVKACAAHCAHIEKTTRILREDALGEAKLPAE